MQPLDVCIFGPVTAVYRRLITDLAPHMDAGGIDKAQFGTCYTQAWAKVLMSAAAKKAFQDTGIAIDLNASKVLDRLAGSSAAPCQSGTPQPAEQEVAKVPGSATAFENMLDTYRKAEDPRNTHGLKKTLLEAFEQTQMELAAV